MSCDNILYSNNTTFDVFWSKEDNEYVAVCPAFPSLSFLASTRDKALQGIKELVNADND